MLCQFQVYSMVNQLYIYMYPLFFFIFRFFSHIGHYRVPTCFKSRQELEFQVSVLCISWQKCCILNIYIEEKSHSLNIFESTRSNITEVSSEGGQETHHSTRWSLGHHLALTEMRTQAEVADHSLQLFQQLRPGGGRGGVQPRIPPSHCSPLTHTLHSHPPHPPAHHPSVTGR